MGVYLALAWVVFVVRRRQRIVDKRLLRAVASQPCAVCFADAPSDPHHLVSRGAGGPDLPYNILPACRRCHQEIHQLGLEESASRRPMLKVWLRKMGWELIELFGRKKWKWNEDNEDTEARWRDL